MDGFMRLVDASKRALASPSRKAGSNDGDPSIDSMGHVGATALPKDDVLPTTPVQDTLGTIDPNIGNAGVSDTNLGIASVVAIQALDVEGSPKPEEKHPLRSVELIDPNIGETGLGSSLGVRKPKVQESSKPDGFLGVRIPRVHPPDKEESSTIMVKDDAVEVIDIDKTDRHMTVSSNVQPKEQKVFNVVLNDVEVIDVDLVTPLLCPHVYEFKGANQEFERRPSDTRNFKSTVGKILNGVEKSGYGEIDLYHLQNWYKDFRFSPMVSDEEDIDGNKCHFRLVMINPGESEAPNEVYGFLPFLSKFYRQAFSNTEATRKNIDLAISRQMSMMIILIKCRANYIVKPFSQESKKSLRIIAAATFGHAGAQNVWTKLDMHLSWFAVKSNDSMPLPPPPFLGWRRKGFGLFMLKCMIKYMYATQSHIKECDVYLQCYEPESFNFYSKVGFVQINQKYDDGFSMLPPNVQHLLWNASSPSRDPGDCLFHFFKHGPAKNKTAHVTTPVASPVPKKKGRVGKKANAADLVLENVESKPYMLMVLRSGCLRHIDEAPSESGRSKSDVLWCKYPPPNVDDKLIPIRYVHDMATMKKWFSSLPLIKSLLPPPYSEVASPSSLTVKGELYIESRLQHTKSNGETWLNTGNVDMLMSVLLWDGRYNDHCHVFSVAHSQLMGSAFFMYRCLQKAQYMFNTAQKSKNVDMEEVHETIVQLYRYPVHELAEKYEMLRNALLKQVITPNPGLLSRRVLVFTSNESKNHWSALFVFNASYIDFVTDDEDPSDTALRPCFFRYCSQKPEGRRGQKTSFGYAWFLNLCYSVRQHEAKQALTSKNTLTMHHPFGSSLDGFLVGTPTFPALYLPVGCHYLPKQHDGFNCGIGTVAGIAIMLRDVVCKDMRDANAGFSYDELFSVKTLSLATSADTKPNGAEAYCLLPEICFDPLPTHVDYLALVREQWFRLFDLMAEEQHVTLPTKRLGPFHEVNAKYLEYKPAILAWPTSPVADTKNLAPPRQGPKRNPPHNDADNKKDDKKPGIDDDKKTDDDKKNDENKVTGSDNNKQKKVREFVHEFQMVSEVLHSGELVAISEDKLQFMDSGQLRNIDGVALFTNDANIAELPLVFPAKRVRRPAKRKRDDVELEAITVLNKIKAKNAKQGEALEKARAPVRKRTREVCSQSKAFCDTIASEYGTDLPPPTVLNQSVFQKEMNEYIEQSFIAWGYHSNLEHNAELKKWVDKRDNKKEPLPSHILIRIKQMIKSLQNERKKFTTWFANEFKFTQKTLVKSVKFDEANDVFVAQLCWIEEEPVFNALQVARSKTPIKPDRYKRVEKYETIPVEKEWVKEQFGSQMYQQIINMRQDPAHMWVQAPRDVAMYIGKQKVVSVRYVAASKMKIVDAAALSEEIDKAYQAYLDTKPAAIVNLRALGNDTEEARMKLRTVPTQLKSPSSKSAPTSPTKSPAKSLSKQILRGRRLPLANPSSKPSPAKPDPQIKRLTTEASAEAEDMETPFEAPVLEDPPRKEITVPARWTGKTKKGDIVHLDEAFVRASFGDAFTNEMMKMNRGFIDIPVGDYKASRLHDYPSLHSVTSPSIQYMQSEGKDLCVSKSLASTFYALRWENESARIDAFGEEILNGLVMNALEKVVHFARTLFPSWIVISRMKPGFDWKTDLQPHDVFIGVLLASDESCSHAVTLHGGFVFDANEPVALRLCDESLDYCTSTENVKSSFVKFKRGYLFRHNGMNTNRIARMTIKTTDMP